LVFAAGDIWILLTLGFDRYWLSYAIPYKKSVWHIVQLWSSRTWVMLPCNWEVSAGIIGFFFFSHDTARSWVFTSYCI